MTESNVQKWVEELILIFLIVINILEFTGLIEIVQYIGIHPVDLELVKAIISIAGIGYVIYKSSLSEIFFGNKNRKFDFIILVLYFLLIANKFVELSFVSVLEIGQEVAIFGPLAYFINNNTALIETIGFIVGNLGILFLALYVAFNVQIHGPSILHALYGERESVVTKLGKFFSSYLVMISFHLLFFSLVMEWLTLVIDAPLIIFAIFFYMFKVHKVGKAMDTEHTLFKIADFVDEMVEGFVKLFHSRKTLFLGISGMLVLHLLTDLLVFIVPYTLGMSSNLYLADSQQELGNIVITEAKHRNLGEIFKEDKLLIEDRFSLIILIFGYMFNIIGISFLLIFPLFIWYVIYSNKLEEQNEARMFPSILISLFFSSLIYVILLPAFKLGLYEAGSQVNYFGVDITTHSIAHGNYVAFFIIAAIILLVVLFLNINEVFKNIMFFLMTISAIIFFSYYFFFFIKSQILVNLDLFSKLLFDQNIIHIFSQSLHLGTAFADFARYFIVIFSSIYLIITLFAYIGAYLTYVVSVFTE